jgi:Beta-propeller repeat
MKLVGANPNPQVEGVDPLPGKSNYFIGSDPQGWRTDIANYARVPYREVYPGVDLVYYGTPGQLEYDWVVAPGADPNVIRLAFEGVEELQVDAQGELVLQVGRIEIQQHKPVVYQQIAGPRHTISGRYVIKGKYLASFQIGEYDLSQPLVIDPVLVYSTYLGGSGNQGPSDITVDTASNIYVVGSTASADFPLANPVQDIYRNHWTDGDFSTRISRLPGQ